MYERGDVPNWSEAWLPSPPPGAPALGAFPRISIFPVIEGAWLRNRWLKCSQGRLPSWIAGRLMGFQCFSPLSRHECSPGQCRRSHESNGRSGASKSRRMACPPRRDLALRSAGYGSRVRRRRDSRRRGRRSPWGGQPRPKKQASIEGRGGDCRRARPLEFRGGVVHSRARRVLVELVRGGAAARERSGSDADRVDTYRTDRWPNRLRTSIRKPRHRLPAPAVGRRDSPRWPRGGNRYPRTRSMGTACQPGHRHDHARNDGGI